MFGKVGRPPEDRVQRRREIWLAVSPLIERHGARALTMRDAAAAACLSLGGLYHYFPNKRALVLFGTDQEVHQRICAEFDDRYGHLRDDDPPAHLEAFIRFFAGKLSFIRPAVQAALELGADGFRDQLSRNLEMGLEGFVGTLRAVVPDADEAQLRALATAIRRLFFASLVDPAVTVGEFEVELRALIRGMVPTPLVEEPAELSPLR